MEKFRTVAAIAAECGESFPPVSRVAITDKETIAEEHITTAFMYLEKSNIHHSTKSLAKTLKHPEEWVKRILATKTYKKMLEDKWKTSLECAEVIVVGARIPDDPFSRPAMRVGSASGSSKRYRRNE